MFLSNSINLVKYLVLPVHTPKRDARHIGPFTNFYKDAYFQQLHMRGSVAEW